MTLIFNSLPDPGSFCPARHRPQSTPVTPQPSTAQQTVMDNCTIGTECKIAVECDHRIANHMTMLAGYIRLKRADLSHLLEQPDTAGVLRLFDAIGAQVAAVSELHRMLSASSLSSSGDIGEQLDRMCAAFRNGPASGSVIDYTGGPGCILPVRHILPVLQIVSEVMTNALKYGHKTGQAGRVRVGCKRNRRGRITISVDDDGDGLPASRAGVTKPQGIGVTLVAALARQVDGTISYRASHAGLSFILSLPVGVQTVYAQKHSIGQSEPSIA